MYQFRILGGASLEGPDGPVTGRAGQRRQLGVLAVLALARGRPVTRDRLIGLLWPETETERARRQLSDAVYLLRRELGDAAIAAGGDDLRLEPDRIEIDLFQFEAALSAGNAAGAVALYSGPLLDGVFWDGAAEWERQVSAERDLAARAYAGALEALAKAAEEGGDHAGAVAAWRRRAAHDPLDARACIGLMAALAAAGDRAGALQQARVHAALLREELDVGPDPDVEAFAGRLRQGAAAGDEAGAGAARHGAVPGPAPVGVSGAGVAGGEGAPASSHGTSSHGTGAARHVVRWRPLAVAAAVLLMVTSTVWLLVRPAEGTTSSDRLAVLPFATLGGDESVAYLGAGLVDLLSVTLDGAGSLRTVDPRAIVYHAGLAGESPLTPGAARALAGRLGAGTFVRGTVALAGERLRISATLYGAAEAPLGSATVEGSVDELFALVDRLSAELVALHASGPAVRLEHLAARTTESLPALRAYLDAEASFRRRAAQWEPEVVEAFGRAASLDSTFALAHYRLSVAAAWVGESGLSTRAGAQAARFAHRLGRRERELLEAWQARLAGDAAGAEQRYQSLIERYPDDVEASWQLAELLIRVAPIRGDSVTAATAAYRRVLDLDPTHGCARCSLIYIAMQRRDLETADSLASGFPPGQPGASGAVRLVRAMDRGDDAERAAVLRELDAAPVWVVHEAHFRTRMWGRQPAAAVDVGRLVDHPRFPAEWRGLTRVLLYDDELAAGRPAAARATLARVRELEPGWALVLEVLAGLGPVAPATAAERADLLARVEAWQPDTTPPSRGYFTASHNTIYPELRLYLLGVLHASRGDVPAAARAAASLERLGSGLGRYLAAGVRGWLPPDEEALRHLDVRAGMMPAEHVWLAPVLAGPLERFRHAELLDRAGRTTEALRLLNAFGQNPWDASFLAPAHLRMAEILERTGRRDEATRAYARVAELWSASEPAVRPLADAASRRAAELRIAR